jgi:hypothetical protein
MTLFYQLETLLQWMELENAITHQSSGWTSERDHLLATVREWTRKHTVRELFKKGQAMRFP